MAPPLTESPLSLKAKWQLTASVFSVCWLLYFLIPWFARDSIFTTLSSVFETEVFNLVFLMVLFLTVSVLAADAAECFYVRLRRIPWFRPRLGEILVNRGFITEEELAMALDEQQLRIGDVLARAGKVTPLELEHAADYQQSRKGMRLGEALSELGYASPADIAWALEQIHRKLGKILVEQGLINEFDLRRTLGRMWYGRNHGL